MLVIALMTLPWGSPAAAAGPAQERFVAPWGSDGAPGTADAPWGTIQHAIERLDAGDTLTVRGGTYRERVMLSANQVNAGRPDAPVVVRAAAGERPVIEGLLWLNDASHWTVDGLNVTWAAGNSPDEHMVKFRGGTGWRYTNAEVWGARSYAAILVSNGARDFRLDHLYVHDTAPANDLNQDHLIYVATGNSGGVIERNVLANSPNGRGVKVGPGSLSQPGSSGLVIRYNTFVNNTGPSNVRFSGNSSGNQVYGNLMVRPKDGQAAVSAYELTGSGNVVRDNAAWLARSAVKTTDGLQDAGGNRMVDPHFVDVAAGDFRPTNPEAAAYGAHAPGDAGPPVSAPAPGTTPTPTPAPPSETPSTPAPIRVVPVSPGSPTSANGHDAFVRAVVQDFLGRDATGAERTTLASRLAAGAPRAHIARSFAFSSEWIGGVVDGYYRSTLGRRPDPAGSQHWIQVMRAGATPAAVAAEFYASGEYFRRSGNTNRAWIGDLYDELLGRTTDPTGAGYWVDLADRGVPRSTIAFAFYQSVESRAARVEALYQELLGRRPDEAGHRHWVAVIANGRDIDLALDLATSDEYARRSLARFS